ncbi:hypothetical protein F4778DRAFT_743441 [Xylariomycetidae sp. FL2044]|nr:hypothetical protein F4778DRAFT_743441 [Xylariomycetidae sp. FL2044]
MAGPNTSPSMAQPSSVTNDAPIPSTSNDQEQEPETEQQDRFEEEAMPSLADLLPWSDGQYYCWEQGCGKGYPRKRDLTKHLRQHYKPVFCPVEGCPSRAAEQRDMERHVQTHNIGAKDKSLRARKEYTCKSCGKKFTRTDNLQRHQKKNGHH